MRPGPILLPLAMMPETLKYSYICSLLFVLFPTRMSGTVPPGVLEMRRNSVDIAFRSVDFAVRSFSHVQLFHGGLIAEDYFCLR